MSESQEELSRSPRSIQRASGSHEVSYLRDLQPSQSLCSGQPAEPLTDLCATQSISYLCGRPRASPVLFIRQQIIESFDLHHRHNHAEALLVMRKIVYHRFVRNEPSSHGHSDIDRLTSRKSLFEFAPQRR